MATPSNDFGLPLYLDGGWNTVNNANWNSAEQGHKIPGTAGVAINTFEVLWMNSGGYFFQHNPNSSTSRPHAISYSAVNSGDAMHAVTHGVLTGISSYSTKPLPGMAVWASDSNIGTIVRSLWGGLGNQLGVGGPQDGSVLFRPDMWL